MKTDKFIEETTIPDEGYRKPYEGLDRIKSKTQWSFDENKSLKRWNDKLENEIRLHDIANFSVCWVSSRGEEGISPHGERIFGGAECFKYSISKNGVAKLSGIVLEDDATYVTADIAFAKTLELEANSEYIKALECLDELLVECENENWDGYGAKPLTDVAYKNALQFIKLLPIYIPCPSITVDPDGEIHIEWSKGKEIIFAISIGETKELNYSYLNEQDEMYGMEKFKNEIPGKFNTIFDEMLI